MLAEFPPHKVLIAEAFHRKLDCPLAAHLEDERVGDTRIQELPLEIRISGQTCLDKVRHTGTVTQQVDGLVKLSLMEGTQFGKCLGIVQEHFTITEYGDVIVGLVQLVEREVIVSHHELGCLETGHCAKHVHALLLVGIAVAAVDLGNSGISRDTDGLGETRVAVGDFLGELHCLPALPVGKA